MFVCITAQAQQKQIMVIWLSEETIVNIELCTDTANIEIPLNTIYKQGKHFERWEQSKNTHLDFIPDSIDKIVYKAIFADNELRNYTINHYKEKIQDSTPLNFKDNYDLVLSEQKEGIWGTLTSAIAKEYDGYIVPVVNQQPINENDSTIVNIYYDRETYTLVWNTNGGIITSDFAYGALKYGYKITVPHLVRAGYTYKWDNPIPEALRTNSTFSAIWTANKYPVKWLMNDGTDSIFCSEYIDYESNIQRPEDNPSRTGYEFKGWAQTSTNTVVLTDFGKMIDRDTINKRFYAIWEPNTYEVLWLYNNNTDSIFHNNLIKFDSIILPPSTDPTCIGYKFIGWGQEFNSDTAITNFGKLNNIEGMKFYAIWEPYDTIAPIKKAVVYKSYTQPKNKKSQKKINSIATDTSISQNKTNDITETITSPISITPNPTDSKAYYKNPNMRIGNIIKIYDNNGKLLITQTVANENIEEVDLSNLPQGLYIIELNGEQLQIVKI